MLNTSPAYKTGISASVRESKPIVIVDFLGDRPYPFATATASTTDAANGFDAKQACDGRFRFTHSKIGTGYLPAGIGTPKNGWRGLTVADVNGVLPTAETLTITYNDQVTTGNFWMIGTESNYPVDFTIEALVGNVWTMVQDVTGNANSLCIIRKTGKYAFTQLRITVTKISVASQAAQVWECGAITTLVLNEEDVVDFDILEESKAENGNPLGLVSSNTCTLVLSNAERWYTGTHDQSPFYGLMLPNVRLTPYVGLSVADNTFEYMPLSIYKLLQWDVPSESMEATLTGYDRMMDMGQKPVPMIRTRINTNIRQLFVILFDALGLAPTEYQIESTINVPMPYGWIPKGNVGQALQLLAIAGNCNVYIDRLGIIRIADNFATQASVSSWTDEDQIISANNPQRFTDTYSKIAIALQNCTVDDESDVFNKKVTIDAGATITIDEAAFSTAPVAYVGRVIVNGASGISLSDVKYGSHTISFKLTNIGPTTEVTVTVRGRAITANPETHTIGTNVLNDAVDRTLTVDNPLIQNYDTMKRYAQAVLKYVSDPLSSVTLELRGDPSIELMDVVTVDDPTDKIVGINIVPIRQAIRYDGGLSISVSAKRQVIPKSNVFIAPGLWVSARQKT